MLNKRDFYTDDKTELDAAYFQRRWGLIVEQITALEQDIGKVSGASDKILTLGLARINEALSPALVKLSAAATDGFLVANSATSLTPAADLEATLTITDDGARGIFIPPPFVNLSRAAEGAEDDYATCRVESYDPDTGALEIVVVAVSASLDGQTHSDWVVSASAGLAKMILEAVASVAANKALAEAAAASAAEDAAAVEGVVESGPVVTVNGKAGVVTIGIADIASLSAALAGKAPASHGHSVGDISGLAETIDGGSY